MQYSRWLQILLATIFLTLAPQSIAEQKVAVFAAASLGNAVSEIASLYEKEGGVHVATSFASSSALAKQIENGAPADVFISADLKWMDYLQDKSKIEKDTRRNLLGNRLVLIAPKGKGFGVKTEKGFDFAKAFDGRLCTGDVDSVPVGIYAKQSLKALAWWDAVKSRIVGTQDVRAALVFVERGECAVGIVYETDAKVSGKVDVIGVLPESTHDPVVYPVTALSVQGKGFVDYLGSPAASAVFARFGFTVLGK